MRNKLQQIDHYINTCDKIQKIKNKIKKQAKIKNLLNIMYAIKEIYHSDHIFCLVNRNLM